MDRLKGNLFLLITAIIWGTSFVAQKLGMNYIKPFTFGASRFFLGSLVLIPIILIFDRLNKGKDEEKEKVKFQTKDLLIGGFLCGASLFLGASFQQYGIISTTAGKAGFITALYIVLVPLCGIFMRKKLNLLTWAGVGLAVLGLYLLTIKEGLTIQRGDAIVLGGTIFWALQIIFVDLYVDKTDGLKLSLVQFISAGLLSGIGAIVFENPRMADILACKGPILYAAVMVVGVAYTLQILGQKYTAPTVAAIIMSMESVFAVISGAIFLKETMNVREALGCILVFIAVVITQIKPQELVAMMQRITKKA